MFEQFLAKYPPDTGSIPDPYAHDVVSSVRGFVEMVAMGAGKSFGRGIFRIHNEREMVRALGLVGSMFPDFGRVSLPIAKDWLGRQFAVRILSTRGQVGHLVLLDPGSAGAYELDSTIEELLDVELISNPVAYLESELFSEWKASNPGIVDGAQCVSLRVPTFLGGATAMDNLEVSDEEVYWAIFGQLRGASQH